MFRYTLALLAGASVIATLAAPVAAQDPAQVERGVQVYADQRCALCHSIAGEGNERGPLDGVGEKLTAEEIEQWMVNPKEMTAKTNATRRPVMRAYPDLPPEDLEALIAYMLSLKSG